MTRVSSLYLCLYTLYKVRVAGAGVRARRPRVAIGAGIGDCEIPDPSPSRGGPRTAPRPAAWAWAPPRTAGRRPTAATPRMGMLRALGRTHFNHTLATRYEMLLLAELLPIGH